MIEEGQAAAIGAGVPINDEHAAAVVDIGGGTTNVAAIISGSIIASRAERIGSSDIDIAIMDRLRRHRGSDDRSANSGTTETGAQLRDRAGRSEQEDPRAWPRCANGKSGRCRYNGGRGLYDYVADD